MSQMPRSERSTVRLQKFLASAGLGSRRACEELITAGRITIDGKTVTELGTQVDPARQRVAFDGEPLRAEKVKYYVVNKPPGYLCTNSDPAGRKRVLDLFPPNEPRLFTVGRLDENSEGLLIVTNDGDFAHRLAHPRYRIYRTYHVQVAGDPSRETLNQLKEGFYFSEGHFRVKGVRPLKRQGKSTHLEVLLTEGQNREIRRLMARIGHKVISLKRVAFGPLRLGRLPSGAFRELRPNEVKALRDIVERNEAGLTAAPDEGRPKRRQRECPAARQQGPRPRGERSNAESGGRSKLRSRRSS